uniref:Uncharacterized protein n=1 Tax=Molossus molossus TaxID=27622 RepID=A0A7J8BKQ0_MOLMO|nr:hypothetical protein HJG59_010174 [Molossus molossus]
MHFMLKGAWGLGSPPRSRESIFQTLLSLKKREREGLFSDVGTVAPTVRAGVGGPGGLAIPDPRPRQCPAGISAACRGVRQPTVSLELGEAGHEPAGLQAPRHWDKSPGYKMRVQPWGGFLQSARFQQHTVLLTSSSIHLSQDHCVCLGRGVF